MKASLSRNCKAVELSQVTTHSETACEAARDGEGDGTRFLCDLRVYFCRARVGFFVGFSKVS